MGAAESTSPDELDTVVREVVLDAGPEAVWDVLTDGDARRAWLDDDADRPVRVDDAVRYQRLVWTWWDDDGAPSRVTITLTPSVSGTVLRVVERLTIEAPQARAAAGAAGAAWDRRTLGLELLLLDLAVLV